MSKAGDQKTQTFTRNINIPFKNQNSPKETLSLQLLFEYQFIFSRDILKLEKMIKDHSENELKMEKMKE